MKVRDRGGGVPTNIFKGLKLFFGGVLKFFRE